SQDLPGPGSRRQSTDPAGLRSMQRGMVIVGAGESGARAAFALREQGWAGQVTLVGEEAHAPYERPPLSKATLIEESHPLPRYMVPEERFTEQNIAHISNHVATGLDRDDRRLLLSDGSDIPYEKLLIATGASPRRPPLLGADHARCVTLRRYEDALH